MHGASPYTGIAGPAADRARAARGARTRSTCTRARRTSARQCVIDHAPNRSRTCRHT
ncbi:conserved hypothetical protein [Burkholderia pseudomallei MSHR346]|nr:conserved hypothetical protein [Burkholderia pseudomallei MSHR346]